MSGRLDSYVFKIKHDGCENAWDKVTIPNPDFSLSKTALIEEDLVNQDIYQYTFPHENADIALMEDKEMPKVLNIVLNDEIIGQLPKTAYNKINKLYKAGTFDHFKLLGGCGMNKYVRNWYDDYKEKEVYEYTITKDQSYTGYLLVYYRMSEGS